tara:strand:+ start:298 stop:549 length:252 start_codon:yes stop_codon:yes gene_type:complete
MNRKLVIFDADGNIEATEFYDFTWDQVRKERDRELQKTDWWALKDLTMSQAKKDYRKFLRDMPANYETANEAADAWAAYEIPE